MFTLLTPWGLESAARTAGIIRVVSKSGGLELMRSIEQVLSQREISTPERRQSNSTSRIRRNRETTPKPYTDLQEGEDRVARILIADDQESMRRALKTFIGTHPDRRVAERFQEPHGHHS
jgi:hypothetical protein